MGRPTIALDYDGTWNVSVGFWRAVLAAAAQHGVTVIMVTNRGPHTPITEDVGVPIFYANGRPKRAVAAEAGYEPVVWIDDFPHLVDFGHSNPVTVRMGLP